MNKRSNSVIKTVPAASALHSVPMFDPLKLLRITTSAKTGEKVLRLDLSYKKMWFLLVHPRGRMLTKILRVTDQMAIFQAQLFADRDDDTVLAQFTSCHTRRESGPQYIRNAQNEALNKALDNAGFELYAGFLHADRPGKPSLVLDFMEEYRAWVVDRNIIKIRNKIAKAKSFDLNLKSTITEMIGECLSGAIVYKRKRIKLENLMQRQAYRLAGSLIGEKSYKGIRFKW